MFGFSIVRTSVLESQNKALAICGRALMELQAERDSLRYRLDLLAETSNYKDDLQALKEKHALHAKHLDTVEARIDRQRDEFVKLIAKALRPKSKK